MGWQRFKVYTPEGKYIASCDYVEDAATIVLRRGAGASVRLGYLKWQTTLLTSKGVRVARYVRVYCPRDGRRASQGSR